MSSASAFGLPPLPPLSSSSSTPNNSNNSNDSNYYYYASSVYTAQVVEEFEKAFQVLLDSLHSLLLLYVMFTTLRW